MYKIIVKYKGTCEEAVVREGQRLQEVILSLFRMAFPCGGRGSCGKCKIKVLSGSAPSVTGEEIKLLTAGEIQKGVRLACAMKVSSAMEIEILAGDEEKSVVLADGDLTEVSGNMPTRSGYGVAVDVGTTTIALYPVDFSNKKLFPPVSAMNWQRAYGGDVVSRMKYCLENQDGDMVLHKALTDQLNAMIEEAGGKYGFLPKEVVDIAFCANTVITHFFLDLPTETMSRSPFTPVFSESASFSAQDLGLCAGEKAMVSVAGCPTAFVGGDITAGAAFCGLLDSKAMTLFVDIGTNGEILLGNKDMLAACSCAAGPAFEGAHIKWGMGGAEGAINKIWFEGDALRYTTIGDGEPTGICGSGLLDGIYWLLKKGVIDETGFMEEGEEIDGETVFPIAGKIHITQKDIRQVQLAKAAIRAGIETLLNSRGLSWGDLDRALIAGGFGNYMDLDSAMGIGLLPAQLKGKLQNVGNSAGKGALSMLTTPGFSAKVERVRKEIEYLELSESKFFNESYVEQMMFN